MSGYIQQQPQDDLIRVEFPSKYVYLAIQYCEKHNFQKKYCNIQYPMASRFIEENVEKYDAEFVEPMLNNFDEMLMLFKVAKAMQIEPLYQLMAASIATFFRNRCMEDVKRDLNLQSDVGYHDNSEVEKKFSWVFNEQEKANMEF